ncbi:SpoIIE family protein phosphatase [Pelolinea submarina]|uniref:Serine phosphatase RsbU (Regulator of sigma subunit) n=1 Tax=Pelolinea submarina TaxID=913107 RepID=A0A347ZNA0_9CHLR|nr:SpoIIE family protein phosphatase [Pelolinea submarina]REG05559.1 serine phosphatase RsbU (regulator of sigma subunit) [Pelolinea submarina]BBB46781.1 phosphoserine phosphatase RsbU/P [Pelolinea submarina]
MQKAPNVLNQAIWRQLFELGDLLLAQDSIYGQVDLIKIHLSAMVGAEVDVRLNAQFRPLPDQQLILKKQFGEAGSNSDIFIKKDESFLSTTSQESFKIVLQKENEPFGWILLTFPEPVDISEEWRNFLEISGRYLAGILDMTRLTRLKDWRFGQLALVRNVGMEIVRFREPFDLFNKIVQLVQDTFQFYFVALYTFDEEEKLLALQASAGQVLSTEQRNFLTMGKGIPLGEGLVGGCAAARNEIHAPDVTCSEKYRPVEGLSAARSEICFPLLINDQLLGVLEILSDEPDAFHENDVMVLHILADSISLAIENAELFDDIFEKTWISTVMLQVAEAAQAYDNLDDLFEAIVRILPLLVGVEKCAIYMPGKDSAEFYLNAHYGFQKSMEAKLAMLPYEDQAAERFHQVAVLKIPLDFDEEFLNDGEMSKLKKDVHCCKLVPMVAHSRVFGLLLVDELRTVNTGIGDRGSGQQSVLVAVARQIALAIENFELRESQEYEAYITAVLLQVAEMVAASVNLDETLCNVTNLLPLVVGVDTALIYLHDEATGRLQLRSSHSQTWKSQVEALPPSIKLTNQSLDAVREQQQPVFCEIGELPPADWLQIDYRVFLRSKQVPDIPEPVLILFPLYITDDDYGFLIVLESSEGHELREKKVEIIKGVAQQLSIAIQNESLKKEMVKQERVRREIQLAQEIQRTFLPEKLPQIPGWEISVRWRPALQVGGDFYDAIPIGEHQLGLVVADVSDKGLPAALTMTVARTLIHAAAQSSSSPAETLQHVNRMLMESSHEGLFVTVFYAVLDIETGELVYTNAGHNLPLLLRKHNSQVIWLEKGAMPLGVQPALALENKTLQIRPGDHLVMYTDGVTEARSPVDAIFGEGRLYGLLKTYVPQTDLSLIEMLDSKLLEFQANAQPSDDVTIYVIRRVSS